MLHLLSPIPAAKIRLIVFDLDGTLIDSRRDLTNSINAMLTEFGREPLPEEIIATYIGDGAGMLVRRALGDPESTAERRGAGRERVAAFSGPLSRAQARLHLRLSWCFESLEAMRTAPDGTPRKMAVLTNKPVIPSVAICDALGLSPYMFRIYGGNSFASKKPDPEGLNTVIREAEVSPGETLMIGDSNVDILTARRAGTWVLGCRFGLSSHTVESIPSDCLVDSASEWAEALTAEARKTPLPLSAAPR